MDELELIAAARNGHPAAERKLYDTHVDWVYRLAFRLMGDDDLASDCTQETFIRAFERLEQFRGEAAFATWLRTIASTVALNRMRKIKRFHRREVDLDEGLAVGAAQRRAEPDLKERLRAAIDDLPVKYRTVFVMHDVEGYTHDEIAAALDMPPGTSKAQLSRARAKLRAALAAFAGEWAS